MTFDSYKAFILWHPTTRESERAYDDDCCCEYCLMREGWVVFEEIMKDRHEQILKDFRASWDRLNHMNRTGLVTI